MAVYQALQLFPVALLFTCSADSQKLWNSVTRRKANAFSRIFHVLIVWIRGFLASLRCISQDCWPLSAYLRILSENEKGPRI